jgi:hypothetical protein
MYLLGGRLLRKRPGNVAGPRRARLDVPPVIRAVWRAPRIFTAQFGFTEPKVVPHLVQ